MVEKPIKPDVRRIGIKEAASRLGVSKDTVRRFIQSNQLSAWKVGNAANAPFVMDVREVDALLDPANRRAYGWARRQMAAYE